MTLTPEHRAQLREKNTQDVIGWANFLVSNPDREDWAKQQQGYIETFEMEALLDALDNAEKHNEVWVDVAAIIAEVDKEMKRDA